ncbi:MAG TPA: acyl-CoA carboxylase epsilon subunit [Candidatus Lumbricidophila sp.]|nr:acyl-CoA carboxylase epsilon subunit [Candidatus Lumbricidophila sp.]
MSDQAGTTPTVQFVTSVEPEDAAAVIAVVTAALEARAAAITAPGHDATNGWTSKAQLVRAPISVGPGVWNRALRG